MKFLAAIDKDEDSHDQFKVLMKGKIERIFNDNDKYPYRFYEELWMLRRVQNRWIIDDINDHVENHEVENLDSCIE